MLDRFHQLAVYHQQPSKAIFKLKAMGYNQWIYDEATLIGEVHGETIENRAQMVFNYEFYGDQGGHPGGPSRRPSELEYLHYSGRSWHSFDGRTDDYGNIRHGEPFVSHMSVYVQDAEEAADYMVENGFPVIQWFRTSEHRNEYLLNKKQTFYEFIFDARQVFGFDLKVIQRIQN